MSSLTSKESIKAIDKILSEVCAINSFTSVAHLQSTIELCIKCVNLADEVIQRDSSYTIGMCYLTICETVYHKLKNDCMTPNLADMIAKKGIMVAETIKRINA